MPLVTGPLFSLAAAGQLQGGPVFRKGRAAKYVQTYRAPTGPPSPAQQITRDTMRTIRHIWSLRGTTLGPSWTVAASHTQIPANALFVQQMMPALRGHPTLAGAPLIPSNPSLPTPSPFVITGTAAHRVSFAGSFPAAHTGYTRRGVYTVVYQDTPYNSTTPKRLRVQVFPSTGAGSPWLSAVVPAGNYAAAVGWYWRGPLLTDPFVTMGLPAVVVTVP